MMGPATSIATDLTEGVIDRFRSLPASRSAYLLGHYLAELAAACSRIVDPAAAGLLVGWRIHAESSHVVAALRAAAAVRLGDDLDRHLIGLSVRSPDAVMGVGFMVVFPLTFLRNAFVPPGDARLAAVRSPRGTPQRDRGGGARAVRQPAGPARRHAVAARAPGAAAFLWCGLILGVAVPLTLARYRQRTTD